jgi:hypothetical protein
MRNDCLLTSDDGLALYYNYEFLYLCKEMQKCSILTVPFSLPLRPPVRIRETWKNFS